MFGSFLIPVLILLAFGSFIAGLLLWARNYIKVPPDQVAIITGRKRKILDQAGKAVKEVNFRIVRGGATFVWPIREMVQYLSLNLVTLTIDVVEAYNVDGVPVSVEAVANVKIKGEDQAISNAVERFLTNNDKNDKTKGAPSWVETARQTLEGHLRSIVGTMSIEDLNSNRKVFAARVTEEAVGELETMGIGTDSIVIKKIKDEHGYLDALGKKKTAEVKRDADVGVAEAQAEAKKKTSDAARDAAEVAATNDQKIAVAQKDLAVKKAVYDAEVNKEQATAAQAGPRATAEAEKSVLVAQQQAKEAEAKAGTAYQREAAGLRQAELEATTIRTAEATKQAAILKADGEAAATVAAAEADKKKNVFEAEANAATIREKGQAEADSARAKYLADAQGIEAKLMAEAKGKSELAKALKELNEAGQLLFLMEKSPEVIKALGTAGAEIVRGMFEPVGQAVGSIDSISVYDSGSGENGAMQRATGMVPDVIFNFLQRCKAGGVENIGEVVTNLVKLVNDKMVGKSDEVIDTTVVKTELEDTAAPVSAQAPIAR